MGAQRYPSADSSETKRKVNQEIPKERCNGRIADAVADTQLPAAVVFQFRLAWAVAFGPEPYQTKRVTAEIATVAVHLRMPARVIRDLDRDGLAGTRIGRDSHAASSLPLEFSGGKR